MAHFIRTQRQNPIAGAITNLGHALTSGPTTAQRALSRSRLAGQELTNAKAIRHRDSRRTMSQLVLDTRRDDGGANRINFVKLQAAAIQAGIDPRRVQQMVQGLLANTQVIGPDGQPTGRDAFAGDQRNRLLAGAFAGAGGQLNPRPAFTVGRQKEIISTDARNALAKANATTGRTTSAAAARALVLARARLLEDNRVAQDLKDAALRKETGLGRRRSLDSQSRVASEERKAAAVLKATRLAVKGGKAVKLTAKQAEQQKARDLETVQKNAAIVAQKVAQQKARDLVKSQNLVARTKVKTDKAAAKKLVDVRIPASVSPKLPDLKTVDVIIAGSGVGIKLGETSATLMTTVMLRAAKAARANRSSTAEEIRLEIRRMFKRGEISKGSSAPGSFLQRNFAKDKFQFVPGKRKAVSDKAAKPKVSAKPTPSQAGLAKTRAEIEAVLEEISRKNALGKKAK